MNDQTPRSTIAPDARWRGASWEAAADLVVVGSGVAGLSAALEASRCGLRAVVVSKGAADEGNTRWAQGGVAVVLSDGHDDGDSLDRHIRDTIVAGAGLCDPAAVTAILGDGLAGFTTLQRYGATFDRRPDGSLALTREGGHTAFRIVHAGGDATGAEIERALLTSVESGTILQRHAAVDIVRTPSGAVAGLLVLDHTGVLGVIRAPAVLLATGGAGQMYESTSNDAVATGDGLALGLRAGAEVGDMEFVQFHPTVLYTGRGTSGGRPLVTEALRGEGAVLRDATGAVAVDRATGGLPRLDGVTHVRVPCVEVADRSALQRAMTAHGSIGRDASGLATIARTLDTTSAVRELRTRADVEDAALALTARSVVAAAQAREESRGCHVRQDHPATDDRHWQRSLIVRLDRRHRPVVAGVVDRRAAA